MSLRINSLLLSIRSVWEFKTIQLYKWWLGISGLILKFCCVVEKHKFIANFAFSHLLMSMKIYRNLVKLSGKFVQFSLTAFDIGGNRSCSDAFLKSSICWCEQSQLMAFSHNERKKNITINLSSQEPLLVSSLGKIYSNLCSLLFLVKVINSMATCRILSDTVT